MPKGEAALLISFYWDERMKRWALVFSGPTFRRSMYVDVTSPIQQPEVVHLMDAVAQEMYSWLPLLS